MVTTSGRGAVGFGSRARDTAAMDNYEDMSPWAVHFTTPNAPAPTAPAAPSSGAANSLAEILQAVEESRPQDTTGYSNSMSILWDGHVEPFADPHGAGKDVAEVAERHRSAAFSEIPLHLLDRLVHNRSPYGIGFRQDYLLQKGGGRVWYLESDSAPAVAVREQVAEQVANGVDPASPLWTTTPFIDFPDPEHPFLDWRWEREWRVPGGLRFEPDDVAFLFLPGESHDLARSFFEGHLAEHTGPAYLCPYIDVTWERSRIQEQLETAVG